ncbi:MAG: hypothetical protein PVSMB8_06300 [Vulcanimicrobiaceae bacterium]
MTSTRPPVRILYIPASGKAGFRQIANDLTSLFELVGEGQLDLIDLGPNLSLFCDESRDNVAYAYNFSVGQHHVHGDAFVVRRQGSDVVSIQEDDVDALLGRSDD